MSFLTKHISSLVANSATFEKFVAALDQVDNKQPGLLRVLTYHRVGKAEARPWLDPGLISTSPEIFKEQISYLATNYNVVSVTDVLTAVRKRYSKSLPPRTVLVTFDDAYCDFEEHAWPILEQYEIPVTLFVSTAYPDHPERTFWWDDLFHAVKNTSRKDELHLPTGSLSLLRNSRIQTYQRLKNHIKTMRHADAVSTVQQLCKDLGVQPKPNNILSWKSLRKLANDGVTLGAHTRTHPLMNRITIEEAQEEAVGSLTDLKLQIGNALPIFAYPSGEFSDEVNHMLEREGFELAFTTKRGINNIDRTDPLQIRRINIGSRTTLSILRAQMLSWTVHLNRLQSIIKI